MVLANVEWLGTLCTFLAIVCAGQLIITGFLAFAISEILYLTGSQIATGIGLIAGFVVLPTALRLKAAQISPNMDRIYGYTLCFQRLAIGMSAALHCSGSFFAVYALVTTTNFGNDILRLMRNYHLKQTSKGMVDNVQFALQCCGAYSYRDWYNIDWGGLDFDVIDSRKKPSVAEILFEDTDSYPDLATFRKDAVPFSCCARIAMSACVPQNLEQLGTNTINTCGCADKLRSVTNILLWFEFGICSLCVLLEVAIFILLHKPPDSEGDLYKSKLKIYKGHNEWEKFSNEKSSNPQIIPSSHSEVTLTKTK